MRPHLETVRAFIGESELIDAGSTVLVGLSGGVDSVVLTEMLHRMGFEVSALHVNYRLRGDSSDEDERFVRAFCTRLGIRLHVETFETQSMATEEGRSVQETARDLRYDALDEAAREASIPRVAVGHHRDDQAETVLLHLFRGTGPEGLAGMPVRRPLREGSNVVLVRPLLCLRRREIEAYAADRGIEWREDASNQKTTYRRSAIRREILPLIEEHFGAAVPENVARSADLMRAYVDRNLRAEVSEAFAAATAAPTSVDRNDRLLGQLDLSVSKKLDSVLRGRVILEAMRRWLPELGAARRTVSEIESLLEAQPGRRLVHPTGVVWRERERLLFVRPDRNADDGADRNADDGADRNADDGAARSTGAGAVVECCDAACVVLEPGHPAAMPIGVVEVSILEGPPADLNGGDRHEEFVDADRLRHPLIVRSWRPGDRFIPLGMEHSKKISDFLTDEKVPPHQRAAVLVVESGDEIVWVVGHRIAESARIHRETQHVARLRFHPAENT